jgi:hypothetical protein
MLRGRPPGFPSGIIESTNAHCASVAYVLVPVSKNLERSLRTRPVTARTFQTASQLIAFLQYLEEERGNCVRTRNLGLAALRSFFRYVGACEGPEMIAQTRCAVAAFPLTPFATRRR